MKKIDNKFELQQIIIDIANKIIELSDNQFEYGIGIDQYGNILEPITSKQEKYIIFPPEYGAKIYNGVFIHNHPSGVSFSLSDFKVAYKSKCKMYVKVINSPHKEKEGFYVFHDIHKHNRLKIEKLFLKNFALEEMKLSNKVKKGAKIDIDNEYKSIEHKVWKKIKKRTGIKYFWVGFYNENRND